MKKIFSFTAFVLTAVVASFTAMGCASNAKKNTPVSNLPKVDMSKWLYNEDHDVYYQVGLSYAETPADTTYETMGLFVPGAYFNAVANGDGTYTATINPNGAVGGYTAKTAPYVIPVNTPGYAAMAAPTGFSEDIASYTDAGFVYLYAGARGRDHGAPAGVTDFKAAIRYTRYNADILPVNTVAGFSFGMSGGGA